MAPRYQPEIDWLVRSVRPRVGYDVSEVFTHLPITPSRHVTVVDRTSTIQPQQQKSDGPRCVECAASVIGPVSNPPSRALEGVKKNTVEKWFPCEKNVVEQRLPHVKSAVEQWLPHVQNAVEQMFPHPKNAVEQRLPFADDSVAQQDLRDTGMVETENPCLDEGEVSSRESSSSETSGSSSGSRRLRKSKRNRSGPAACDGGLPQLIRLRRARSSTTSSIRRDLRTRFARSRWRILLPTRRPSRGFQAFPGSISCAAGEIEHVCFLTGPDEPTVLANVASDDASSSRPKAAEPKSVREARFAAQSWSALQDSNSPGYSLAREFEDIFPKKIPAELPAERDFFEGRRKAGHVRESISPHSSPTFCVKKAIGGWRIVHAFNKLNDATIPAQTPISRNDMVLNTMSGSVIYSAIDLTEGFY
ncbi:hypothetical protein PR002_g7642 [Phytophthora rubi]|uniref:Reverse transcriptase domain-containing protein n=1 Tax=Phytophthora rubi TaxID=129364 RepID=A0A6A3MQR6_9STRA|nr:hypothetical protein PR002_g7642 [Phytophthora rubi]